MIGPSRLARFIGNLAGRHVLCVGDIMLDHYVYGAVSRISPEAPVPVLRIEREACMLGGAGNVARNLTALGARVTLAGASGLDRDGDVLAQTLAAVRGLTPQIVRSSRRTTTVKRRFVSGGQQLLRADREVIEDLDLDATVRLLETCTSVMPAVDVVMISDYAKGAVPPALLTELIGAARQLRKPVLVDPKGRDFSRYRGVAGITPNLNELAAATGLPCGSDAEVVAAGRRVAEITACDWVLVTRSERGATLVPTGAEPIHLSARAKAVNDVSGAGDTVFAVLALMLAAGASVADAALVANVAGGVVVSKLGTAALAPDELAAALNEEDHRAIDAKIRDADSAESQAGRWRDEGLRIGFTNGCFDLLHPGHISLLRSARTHCDRLIVGLNSDSSVKRLKGAGRPVQTELARATVLASLSAVDLVVIFEQDTPLDLIKVLRPDLLIKGADYNLEAVVGAEEVQEAGGRVLLLPLVDGQSTSATIRKLAQAAM